MTRKLLVFDVDGVLVEKRSSWSVIHEALGTSRAAEVYARLFWEGRLSYADWMLADTQLWIEASPGITRGELLEILSVIDVLGEAYDAVELARKKGWMVALVSGGVDLLVERVARELRVDKWVSPRLLFDEKQRLLPGGLPLVEADAKHRWIVRLREDTGAAVVAVVGDTRLDAPMMRLAECGVAVNPADNVVVRAAEGRTARDPLEAVEVVTSLCP